MRHWGASDALQSLIDDHGSPLNIHCIEPFHENISKLNKVAADREIAFCVYFARKANKCLGFVDAARKFGCGVDTASPQELKQVLDAEVDPSKIICTAAIKETDLLSQCVEKKVTIAIDNEEELIQARRVAEAANLRASIALRISGFTHRDSILQSRFGFRVDEFDRIVAMLGTPGSSMDLHGLHFHLDGYNADHRISALQQLLPLIDQARMAGHPIRFIDMGGGFPMSYLDSAEEWHSFTQEHDRALSGQRSPITFDNDGLGKIAVAGEVHGKANVYPAYQELIQERWLAKVLDAPFESGTLANALRKRSLELRCEPGRSILDGCGMTIARVAFRKRHTNGEWLVGLAMNRTQCRTSHAEFMVDPLLIRNQNGENADHPDIKGYLVGAYCMESEFIFRRRMRFPQGVEAGDLIMIPNTAGYFMHFVESRSHQFPLAKNFFVSPEDTVSAVPDPIDD